MNGSGKRLKGCRIALLYPHADLQTNPGLLALLYALAGEGAHLCLYMTRKGRYPYAAGPFEIRPFPGEIRLWSGSLAETLANWAKPLQGSLRGRRNLFSRRFDLVVGVNSEGIIAAERYARLFGVPLLYLSYEIFFRKELISPVDIREKDREIEASRRADLVVIQDEERAALLAKENSLSDSRFALLPVSPGGEADGGRTDWLNRRFGIREDIKIVIHAGSFEDWTCARELLETTGDWPENALLVVHTRYEAKNMHRYEDILKGNRAGRVIFSLKPLPTDEYGLMLRSAHIGLVLYKKTTGGRYSKYQGENIMNIGLSSGKFASYMKYGLPTVSLGQRTYRRLLGEYRFGCDIDTIGEIPDAIGRILASYDLHSREAKRLFAERLRFDLHWPRLREKIVGLIRQGQGGHDP
ncbi:MAG: hypothetical protein JW950_11095 [Deltaproteobacteria bacterium]|nr:hypothetical protein [Deltaproteobacteria bacterium]